MKQRTTPTKERRMRTSADEVPRKPHSYNLREQNINTNRVLTAIDQTHSEQSYFPSQTQLHLFVKDDLRFIFEFVMTQMSAEAGIQKHRKYAEAALMAEFAQLKSHQKVRYCEFYFLNVMSLYKPS